MMTLDDNVGVIKNMKDKLFSVVIPVYNSENIVGDTIDQTVSFLDSHDLRYEIILINDGSTDASWHVIYDKAQQYQQVVAINLLHNFGQQNANLCGFRHSRGDYIITMDDDLQNPPQEIVRLINKAADGYDLVIGQFREKKHVLHRRLGTLLIGLMNRKIFNKPKDFVLSNFRLIRRDVVNRICNYKTSYPYVPGLCLMFSNSRANVLVEHHLRREGKSNYSLLKILRLVMTILFNYSSYPMRLVGSIGMVVSLLSLLLGIYYMTVGLLHGTAVPGWLTLVIMLSFLNSIIILILSMLGEYVIRLVNQSSSSECYYVKEVVGRDE